MRAVGLCEVGTHALLGAALGSIHDGERKLAKALLGRVDADMLISSGRGFYSFDLWRDYWSTGAALLWRMSTGLR